MICFDENEIGSLSADHFIAEKEDCMEQLKSRKSFDLIVDCSKLLLPMTDLETINDLQKVKERVMVVVVSTDQIDSLPMDWNAVPTQEEAFDFISFERMQRDLGF